MGLLLWIRDHFHLFHHPLPFSETALRWNWAVLKTSEMSNVEQVELGWSGSGQGRSSSSSKSPTFRRLLNSKLQHLLTNCQLLFKITSLLFNFQIITLLKVLVSNWLSGWVFQITNFPASSKVLHLMNLDLVLNPTSSPSLSNHWVRGRIGQITDFSACIFPTALSSSLLSSPPQDKIRPIRR